ncbi:hypothetical protein ACH3VR_22950 [Microbacterium sp. B2969]|uniref:DUF4157 domain-containing protein n=1 Tax=Microbacterium alkaliflavum TaxID=3248839 RepID=A0ABW7QGH2_9MICO
MEDASFEARSRPVARSSQSPELGSCSDRAQRAEPSSGGAMPERLLGLQRSAGNGAVSGMLARSSPDAFLAADRPVPVQRVIYPTVNALLSVAAGGGLPFQINTLSSELRALWSEAESVLPLTDVRITAGLGRVAQAGVNNNPPPTYVLDYDPHHQPDQNFLYSSILHELVHVSTDMRYRKNGVIYPFLNLNLPPGLGAAAVGPELVAQQQVLDQNIQDAIAVVNADGALPAALHAHVLDRLQNYAGPMPDVHYDTVLADVLSYMELNNVNTGPTFRFVSRMLRECRDRRSVEPWWGTKRARRVERGAASWQVWKW